MAQRTIPVRPRRGKQPVTQPTARRLEQRRLGPTFSPPAWALSSPTRVSRSSEIDGWARLSRQIKPWRRPLPWNPSVIFVFPRLSSPERATARVQGGRCGDRPEKRRRHASARRRATLTRGWARRHRAVALRRPKPGARSRSTLGLAPARVGSPSRSSSGLDPVVSRCGGDPATRLQERP
jgi:hypothetical protein